MPNCQVCNAELDVDAIKAGRCPLCDAPVPDLAPRTVEDVGSLETPGTPPPDHSDEESLDLELSESLDSLDLDDTSNNATLDISPSDTAEELPKSDFEKPRGAGDGTLEFSLDDTDEATSESDPAIESHRHSTQGFDADLTVDLSQLPLEGETGKATTDGTMQDARATVDRTQDDAHATTDASLRELGSKLGSNWQGSFDAGTSVGQTIRQTGTVTGFKSSLPIKSRYLSERPVPGTKPAGPPRADLPDYELLDVIGEGGMGVVYSATQSSIARNVAVKMLKPTKKIREEQRDKFISEAVVTGELDHPNIVPIYDLGANESGALFYSMKRVKGTPWDNVIKKKGLDENLSILLRVADAVAFAHSQGVVHRDLKPENVMLGDFGEVLVMDWGLARITPDFANAESIYQADSLGGTPAYMAPEMARGPIENIDFSSDIYLLGAILYEIIGGRPPHSGRDVMQCLMAAAQNRIDPIEYEGELKVIAMRAMAPQREDRYGSIKDFQEAIRTYQSHSESLVLTSNAKQYLEQAREVDEYDIYARAVYGFQEALDLWDGNEKARELLAVAQLDYARSAYSKGDYDLAATLLDPAQEDHANLLTDVEAGQRERDARHRRIRNFRRIVAALVLAIVGILTFSYFQISSKHRQAVAAREQEEAARREAEEQRNAAVVAKEEEAIARAQEVKAREQETKAKAEAVAERDNARIARDEARAAAEQERIAKVKEEKARKLEEEARAQAEDAKKAEEYEAYVARIGLAQAKIDENAYEFARELLKDCPADLRHWEWGRLVHLCQLNAWRMKAHGPVDAVAFAPDGSRCISGDWSGRATIRDVISGEELQTFQLAQYVHAVDYSADGRYVATGSNDQIVRVMDADTGQQVHALGGHDDAVLSVRFSPDGTKLVSSSYDKTVRLWDLETGSELQVLRGHTWWVWSAVFSPDGSRIVTTGQDGRAIVWQRDDRTGTGDNYQKFTEFSGHDGAVYSASFSPDGRLVATGGYDKKVMVWNPDEAEGEDIDLILKDLPQPRPRHLVLTGHDGPVRSVTFSPVNSRLLLSGSHDNTLRIWDVSQGEMVKILRGHGGRVRSCDFSPDGTLVVSGGHDEFVRLWNIEAYQEVRVLRGRVLQGHSDAVLSARFSSDGSQVVTASRDRTAGLWDVNTGKQIRDFEEGHKFLASSAQFFEDGRLLATGAGDNSVRIWDVATGTELRALSPTGRLGTLAVSPDNQLIVTGTQGNGAVLWNVQTGQRLADIPGHDSEVSIAVFSPRGDLLVTGDQRGNLKIWKTTSEPKYLEPVRDLSGHNGPVTAAKFLPDGSRLITASGDRTCAQWDLSTGEEIRRLALRHPKWVTSLDVSGDGQTALTTCEDGAVRLWALADAQEKRVLVAPDYAFNAVQFAPNGRGALLTSDRQKEVRAWQLAGPEEATIADTTLLVDFDKVGGVVWSSAFSPSGNQIVTIGGNDARLWDLNTGKQAVRFSPHGAVASATLSNDSRYLVTGSWDNSAKIWDATTGKAVRRLDDGHSGFINTAEFSPDGKEILTGSDDGTARLWDFATGKPTGVVFRGHTARVIQAVFSPDGKRVLTASADKTARIWNRSTGKEQLKLVGHDWAVLCAQFSSNGRMVITGSQDNTAKIWDAQSGKEYATLTGHTSSVTSVAFSPDDRRVLTGSQDNTAKLWDPREKKEILTLDGHDQEVTAVAFSPDGRLALTGSRDGTAIVWLAIDWRQDLAIALK